MHDIRTGGIMADHSIVDTIPNLISPSTDAKTTVSLLNAQNKVIE